MKLIPESLASRLTLWNAAVILVFFGVAFPVLYLLVDLALVGDMDADLAEDIESFRGLRESAGLQRVEEEIMREMTDNIAHDMKSPLARIRANLELALTHATTVDAFRASAADTLEDCERMAQMIDATLTLAEAEARADRRGRDRVRLGEVAADACDLFEPVAEDKAIIRRAATFENFYTRSQTLAGLIHLRGEQKQR